MAIPQSKSELASAIDRDFEKLIADLNRVAPERARDVGIPGHKADTTISPANLVAYLIGWNELVLWWFEQRSDGVEPDLPAPGFAWNQLGNLAEQFYLDHADQPWPALVVRLDTAKTAIAHLVDGMSNEDLYGAPWYRAYTAGRMIQLNTASPYRNARQRLRTWLRSQSSRQRR